MKAYEYQNSNNIAESINCLESCMRRFHFIGLSIDQFPLTTQIIQANREILSQAHIDSIYDKDPTININKNFQIKTFKKEKQIKRKWSEKEKKLFQEGIDKFGEKSIIYIFYIYYPF